MLAGAHQIRLQVRRTGEIRGRKIVAFLAALLVANELAERWLSAPPVRIQLYALAVTVFGLFFVPVVTGRLVGLGVVAPLALAAVAAFLNLRRFRTRRAR